MKKLNTLMLMGLVLAFDPGVSYYEKVESPKRVDTSRGKPGVNSYIFGEQVIYARNQKNADRKARNKGLI